MNQFSENEKRTQAALEKIDAMAKKQQLEQKREPLGRDSSPPLASGEATPLPESTAQPDTLAHQSDDAIIKHLASLKLLEYDRVRTKQAKALNVKVKTLDVLVKAARSDTNEADRLPFVEVEPWHSPVDAAALLSELSASFRRYAVLPKHADIALALWCVFTWFCEASHIAPLLVIRSPEKGCGKSTVMGIVARLVRRPLMLSGLSAAVLFRIADKYAPTVLIDEGDNLLNNENNEELHGVLNSGHNKIAPFCWRCVGDNHEPTAFNVFCPKAIAFIGHTRDTLHDRAVEIELRRKLQHEKIARLRQADGDELTILARKLAKFAEDRMDDYSAQRPQLPASLPDRQADNWEPLVQVAMLAGDEWVQRATSAALALTGSKAESAPVSVGVELLADIRQIFQAQAITRIRSTDLVQALCDDVEAGWATFNRSKSITPRQVSNRLKEFGIKPKPLRFGYDVHKGFEVEQFADAFARYLTPPDLSVMQLQPNEGAASDVTEGKDVTVTQSASVTPKPNNDAACNQVTEKPPILGGSEATLPKPPSVRI